MCSVSDGFVRLISVVTVSDGFRRFKKLDVFDVGRVAEVQKS